MNFYVSAVNNIVRTDCDNPTIGIILCRSKRKTIVEFALQGNSQPIGVSTYQLGNELPKALQNDFPTVEQLEMELDAAILKIESQE